MYEQGEDVFYYLALYNETYPMPSMPEEAGDGILRGLYRLAEGPNGQKMHRANLFGSGPMVQQALRAQQLLAEDHDVSADVWSATSYQQLRVDALAAERWNRLHPGEERREAVLAKNPAPLGGPLLAGGGSLEGGAAPSAPRGPPPLRPPRARPVRPPAPRGGRRPSAS